MIFSAPTLQGQLAAARMQNKLTQQGGQNGNRTTAPQVHSCSVSGASGSGNSRAHILTVSAATPQTIYACASAGFSCSVSGGIVFSSEPAKPIESAGIKVGEIIGWRMWNYYKGYLQSYSADRIWAPEEKMTGEPSDNGTDGIWAFKEKNRALNKMLEGNYHDKSNGTIYGSVKLWGKIVEHELGYRAECAKIVSLEDVYIGHGDKQKILSDLRKQYSLVAT